MARSISSTIRKAKRRADPSYGESNQKKRSAARAREGRAGGSRKAIDTVTTQTTAKEQTIFLGKDALQAQQAQEKSVLRKQEARTAQVEREAQQRSAQRVQVLAAQQQETQRTPMQPTTERELYAAPQRTETTSEYYVTDSRTGREIQTSKAFAEKLTTINKEQNTQTGRAAIQENYFDSLQGTKPSYVAERALINQREQDQEQRTRPVFATGVKIAQKGIKDIREAPRTTPPNTIQRAITTAKGITKIAAGVPLAAAGTLFLDPAYRLLTTRTPDILGGEPITTNLPQNVQDAAIVAGVAQIGLQTGLRNPSRANPTPITTPRTPPVRARTISIFEEGGVARATGDLPPGISFTETAPRGVAPSTRQAQQGVPVEFTYESIAGKTQLQTRFGKGDPARSVAQQIANERFGGIKTTERFVFDTAGRSPQQRSLVRASERGVRTESGEFISRIPTSEQILAAGNLKRGGAQGRQTVLDSFVNTPQRPTTAQNIIDATMSTQTSKGFVGIRGRKAQFSITRQQPRARPNPNKLPFGIPGKGQLGIARDISPSINTPGSTTGTPTYITTFVGQNQKQSPVSISEQYTSISVQYDQDVRPGQKQIPGLKAKITPIQDASIITKPKSRSRSRSATTQKQTPIQDASIITKPKSRSRSRSATTQKQTPIQDTPQLTEQTPKIDSLYKSIPRQPSTPSTPQLPQPETPIPPLLPLMRARRQTNNRPAAPGFDVFVRRKGKYVQVGSSLPKSQAVNLGAVNVGTSAAATFKIVASGKKATGSYAGRGRLRDFYKQSANVFIEKTGRRIKSAGELQQITLKGIAANKGKKKKNPLLAAFGKIKPLRMK